MTGSLSVAVRIKLSLCMTEELHKFIKLLRYHKSTPVLTLFLFFVLFYLPILIIIFKWGIYVVIYFLCPPGMSNSHSLKKLGWDWHPILGE